MKRVVVQNVMNLYTHKPKFSRSMLTIGVSQYSLYPNQYVEDLWRTLAYTCINDAWPILVVKSVTNLTSPFIARDTKWHARMWATLTILI